MPPKLKPIVNEGCATLASLRQHLRNRLIQIGMKLDSPTQKNKNTQKLNRFHLQVIGQQSPSLLPTVKSKKQLLLNEFREYFLVNQQEAFSNRETQIKLSKEVIKGNKYNYSVHSSRNTDQSNLKHALRKKQVADNQRAPKSKRSSIYEREVYLKESIQEWNKGLRKIRITQSLKTESNQRYQEPIEKPRRSKTEESTKIQSFSIKKKPADRELGPWESESRTRETQVFFH